MILIQYSRTWLPTQAAAQTKPPSAASSSALAARGHGNAHLGLPPTAGIASGPALTYETIFTASDISNKTIYLGELPFSVNEDKLRDIFGKYGEVGGIRLRVRRASAILIRQHAHLTFPQCAAPTADGVLSKPFAFVELGSHAVASLAIFRQEVCVLTIRSSRPDGQRIAHLRL